jgi:hypothetical protein
VNYTGCALTIVSFSCHAVLCRQVLGLKRQNHQLQQQAAALQEELEAIMALETEEGQGATALHQQQQQLHHQGGMPQSVGQALLKPRPMTAGPTRSVQQQDAAHWRPMSGSPKCRPGSSSADARAGVCLSVQVHLWHALVVQLCAGYVPLAQYTACQAAQSFTWVCTS